MSPHHTQQFLCVGESHCVTSWSRCHMQIQSFSSRLVSSLSDRAVALWQPEKARRSLIRRTRSCSTSRSRQGHHPTTRHEIFARTHTHGPKYTHTRTNAAASKRRSRIDGADSSSDPRVQGLGASGIEIWRRCTCDTAFHY